MLSLQRMEEKLKAVTKENSEMVGVPDAVKPQRPCSAHPVTRVTALSRLCFLNTMLFMKAQIFPYVSKEPLRGEKKQKLVAGSGFYRVSKFAEQ